MSSRSRFVNQYAEPMWLQGPLWSAGLDSFSSDLAIQSAIGHILGTPMGPGVLCGMSRINEREAIKRGRYTGPGAQVHRPFPSRLEQVGMTCSFGALYRYRQEDLLKPCPGCSAPGYGPPCSCDGSGLL